MIGLVPAAGAGSRLRPCTGTLPEALVAGNHDGLAKGREIACRY